MNLDKAIRLPQIVHFSKKKSGGPSPTGPEVLAFSIQCLAKFHLVSYRFIPNFKLIYEDLENIKTNCVDTVVSSLHKIRNIFLGHLVYAGMSNSGPRC